MNDPEEYRSEVLNAIRELDLNGVCRAIDVFREARALGRCVFVCGTGTQAAAAARFFCEMVRESNLCRPTRFRVLQLSEDMSRPYGLTGEPASDRIFVDQLRNTAEHGDVVVGISPSSNSAALLRAFEYANRIGCRTICITGRDGGKLGSVSNVVVLVQTTHAGSVVDAHMIICHMIAYYFGSVDPR